MKKIITASIVILFIVSCASGKKQVNQIMSKIYIGMSISEFNEVVKKKEVVAMREDVIIYRIFRGNWYDTDGSGTAHRYFYFIDNKLSKVDKGQRATDYRIKIDK